MSNTPRPITDWKARRAATKAYAATRDHKGSTSGWIFAPNGASLCQGWDSYYQRYYAQIRDFVTAQVTAMDTFQALVNTEPSYCPTIIPRTWRERYLADAFDTAMWSQQSPRRAWRGTSVTNATQADQTTRN